MASEIYKAVLNLYKLPIAYAGRDYSDINLPKERMEALKAKIATAPTSGSLTIKGEAGPIINHLIDMKRVVRGIDFLDRTADAFEKEGRHMNPAAQVVVLYNVGAEVSLNNKVSGMVFNTIVKHYASQNTLLIISTELTKSELLARYDFPVTNFINLPKKPEDIWI